MNAPSVRKLQCQDLSDISRIHLAAFPNSALGQLGKESVVRYYQWQLEYQPDADVIGIEGDGRLAGFCFGGIFHRALSGFIHKNRGFLAWRVFTHPWLLFSPFFRERVALAWNALRSGRRSSVPQPSVPSRSFGILAIAVDPTLQGEGLGKQLMGETERIALLRGFSRMHLTVAPDNLPAIAFYQKLGWEKLPAQDGAWHGMMVKSLDRSHE